jgi:hypothetical protein
MAKNKRVVEAGPRRLTHGSFQPASAQGEAAGLVNLLRRQGVEVHTANAAFATGGVQVAAGDYVVRMDQPYRTLVDMLMDVQFFAPANPRPYDDTGWTFPYLRNVKATKVADKSILDQPMTLVAPVKSAPRGPGPCDRHHTMTTPWPSASARTSRCCVEEEFEPAQRPRRVCSC